MSLSRLRKFRLMGWNFSWTSRTLATSSLQREVIQAHGQLVSNHRSSVSLLTVSPLSVGHGPHHGHPPCRCSIYQGRPNAVHAVETSISRGHDRDNGSPGKNDRVHPGHEAEVTSLCHNTTSPATKHANVPRSWTSRATSTP